MDLVIQTSLEALLLKATNCQNQNIDTAAVEAFCALVNKEKDGAHIGVKVIADRLPGGNEKEMLQTLNVLDVCMSRCGSQFQSEVGKFRFLNEMIKLVSPKYLGQHTPISVKQKVLQLMYIWTLDYPKESKIKEAYDMLRKQGVIKEIPNPNVGIVRKGVSSVFHDEEKSKILQKLLQSKDPEDIQAANWLIKSMVKEDDKQAELKSRRISELESVQNNVRLLNEMLDSYKPQVSSSDELDLIQELHQSCERLRPNIMRLANETGQQGGADILGEVLRTSDELTQVFSKFNNVIIKGHANRPILLDFDGSPSEEAACNGTTLYDMFTSSKTPADQGEVLQPISIPPKVEILNIPNQTENEASNSDNKSNILDELDVLSEHLLKQNLQPSKVSQFDQNHDKIPMNLLVKSREKLEDKQSQLNNMYNIDLGCLMAAPGKSPTRNGGATGGDDVFLVDMTDEKMLEASDDVDPPRKNSNLKLSDISMSLEDIKASTVAPLTILNEKNGLSITLHAARDKPRRDVRVYVVTTVSKNELALSNYLLQAVVPKGCKLRLLPPSGTDLPPYNPFLPPAAITQIVLIACPDDVIQVSLKVIVSYLLDDETCTEMGQVDALPMV